MGLRSSEQMEIIKFLQRLGFIEISLKHNNHDLSGEERNDKKVSIRERLLHIALIKYQQMEQQQENLLESENNDLSTNEKRIYLSNAV